MIRAAGDGLHGDAAWSLLDALLLHQTGRLVVAINISAVRWLGGLDHLRQVLLLLLQAFAGIEDREALLSTGRADWDADYVDPRIIGPDSHNSHLCRRVPVARLHSPGSADTPKVARGIARIESTTNFSSGDHWTPRKLHTGAQNSVCRPWLSMRTSWSSVTPAVGAASGISLTKSSHWPSPVTCASAMFVFGRCTITVLLLPSPSDSSVARAIFVRAIHFPEARIVSLFTTLYQMPRHNNPGCSGVPSFPASGGAFIKRTARTEGGLHSRRQESRNMRNRLS